MEVQEASQTFMVINSWENGTLLTFLRSQLGLLIPTHTRETYTEEQVSLPGETILKITSFLEIP